MAAPARRARSQSRGGGKRPEVDVLVACAAASLRVGSPKDAASVLRVALRLDPENARAWALAGVALEELGELEEARNHYATALGYDDEDPTTALALAQLHVTLGDEDHARALLGWILTEHGEATEIRVQALELLACVPPREEA